MAKRWRSEELEYLWREYLLGASIHSIATVLGRSYGSIAKRLVLLRREQGSKASKSLDTLIVEAVEWQRLTFPSGSEEGRIEHWKEEIKEWLVDLSSGEEAADVFLLFVAIFSARGIDLACEVERKMDINRARQWHKVHGGYSKHIEGGNDE